MPCENANSIEKYFMEYAKKIKRNRNALDNIFSELNGRIFRGWQKNNTSKCTRLTFSSAPLQSAIHFNSFLFIVGGALCCVFWLFSWFGWRGITLLTLWLTCVKKRREDEWECLSGIEIAQTRVLRDFFLLEQFLNGSNKWLYIRIFLEFKQLAHGFHCRISGNLDKDFLIVYLAVP